MPNPLALHLPDRDELTQPEMDAIRALEPSALLVLAFHSDKGQAEQVNALVRELGHTDLYVRCYGDRIADLSPVDWADACAERLDRYDASVLHCIPGNEMQYEGEGYDGDLGRLMRWLKDFALIYRPMRRDHVLHLPAPWAGFEGEDEARAAQYWQAARDLRLDDLYQAIDVHAYGPAFDRSWQMAVNMFGRRPYVTEFNQGDWFNACPWVEAVRAVQSGQIALATYFTLRWVCWEESKDWRDNDCMSLLRYPELYREFQAAGELGEPLAPPVTQRPTPQEAATVSDDEALSQCLEDLWSLAERSRAVGPLVPSNALPAYWQDHLAEMGSPAGPERPAETAVYQAFTRGVWRWSASSGTVEKMA